ncbi:MAG: VWA domain-containing protein [Thiogranum sp.]
MPEQFHFLQPAWLWALLPLAALLWQLQRPAGADNAWRRVVDARLLPHLLVASPGKAGNRLPLWLLATGWLLAVIALADPVWEQQPQPVYRSQAARVVVLDLSRSMLTPDLKPSRLVRARYKVADILRHSDEGLSGLVVFAGDAFAVAPLTSDSDTILALLEPLEPALMPAQGSRADLGLLKAGELLRQAGVQHGTILLIADGYSDRRSIAAARKLKQQGYRVSVLGVGTAEGAPLPDGQHGFMRDADGAVVTPKLDRAAMQELADAGGGRYSVISGGPDDIDYLLSGAGPQPGSDVARSDRQTDRWQSRGPWLLLLLLPLAALVFRRGWLLVLTIVVTATIGTPQPAMASAWDDLWQRRDQQAYRSLQAGDPEQAARLAKDPLQRGTAEYRAGKFERALQDFAAAEGADAAYNRGNALARLGRYEDAIAAYEQALQDAPGMSDAAHNKAEIEKLLQQQQQQPQQQNGDDKQSGQDTSGSPQQGNDSRNGADRQPSQDTDPQQADADRSGGEQDNQQSGTRDGEQQSDDTGQEQAQQQAEEADDSEQPSAAQEQPHGARQQAEASALNSEEQQAAEQWLRRIPDDPGGLLRRKFLYQYRQRAAQSDIDDTQAW